MPNSRILETAAFSPHKAARSVVAFNDESSQDSRFQRMMAGPDGNQKSTPTKMDRGNDTEGAVADLDPDEDLEEYLLGVPEQITKSSATLISTKFLGEGLSAEMRSAMLDGKAQVPKNAQAENPTIGDSQAGRDPANLAKSRLEAQYNSHLQTSQTATFVDVTSDEPSLTDRLGDKTSAVVSGNIISDNNELILRQVMEGKSNVALTALQSEAQSKTQKGTKVRSTEAILSDHLSSQPKDSVSSLHQDVTREATRGLELVSIASEAIENWPLADVISDEFEGAFGTQLVSHSASNSMEAKLHMPPPTAAAVAQQLAVTVSQNPDGTTELALSPEELGRVSLTMKTHEGAVTLVIATERPETQDFIRKHIESLMQELRELGFHDVQCSFADARQDQSESNGSAITNQTVPGESDEIVDDVTQGRAQHDGLDLRL